MDESGICFQWFSIFFANFERPFTPQTRLRSASNFAKTRSRLDETFHFSTPNIFFPKFLVSEISFSLFLLGF